MKTPIESANYKQLIDFGQSNGLEMKYGSVNQEQAISLIRAAFPDLTEIDIPDSEVVVDIAPARTGVGDTHYSHDPKVTVNIASDDANGGSHHFPITCNGDLILVKRDTNVAIPYRHYLVLRNAVETVMRQEINPLNNLPMTIQSDQMAVRFNVLDMPSKAEIDAWHDRTRSINSDKKKAA